MATNTEYDLTCKKPSEYTAGSGASVAGDKFVMIDVSDGNRPYTRTLQDIIDLSAAADNPMTTAGDIIIGDTGGSPLRLAIGTAGTVLTGGAAPSWASGVLSAQVAVSLAELNAGKTIIAAVTGKQIVVLDFNIVCNGSFGDLTSAELEDSSATINVCSLAQAQMTDDAILFRGATGVTPGVGLAEGITVSEALVITKTGSDAVTATGLTVAITYMLV